jgi:hypothetical protein
LTGEACSAVSTVVASPVGASGVWQCGTVRSSAAFLGATMDRQFSFGDPNVQQPGRLHQSRAIPFGLASCPLRQ